MKYLVSLTLAALALSFLSVYQGWLPLGRLAFDREMRFQGIELISADELQALLPETKSTWWWHWNRPALSAALGAHPLVQSARVESCNEHSWKCFSFRIKERKAALISCNAENAWYVGADGGYIAPLAGGEFERVAALLSCKPGKYCPGLDLVRLPLVQGVGDSAQSPDLVRGQFRALFEFFAYLEMEIGLRVVLSELTEAGEVKVRFAGHAFAAVFSFSGANERYRQEAERLRALLNELKSGSSDLAEVELIFNKMAVVRLVDK